MEDHGNIKKAMSSSTQQPSRSNERTHKARQLSQRWAQLLGRNDNQGHRKQVEPAEGRGFCPHLETQAAGKEGKIHSPGPPVT